MMAMLKVELRKVWVYYVPFLVVIVFRALFQGKPLTKNEPVLAIMAICQGLFLALLLFRDPGVTRPFLFSRPLSRQRLFFIRWTLGLTLQVLTLIVLFAVIAFGARSWLHVKAYSPYHPMVQWFELQVLWPVGLCSLLAYEIGMFLKLRAEILATRSNRWQDTLVQWLASALTVLLLFLPVFSSAIAPISEVLSNRMVIFGLLAYVATITILATAASVHCYSHLEVDA